MLNLALGSPTEIDGKSGILTREGAAGHAIYGPYQHLERGHYVVEFTLRTADGRSVQGNDVCAEVDVVSDFGNITFAREKITLSRLGDAALSIRLPFTTDMPRTFEYRVSTTGRIPLLIEEHCRVLRVEDTAKDAVSVMTETAFPDPSVLPKPEFFLRHVAILRRLHEAGAIVRVVGNDTVVTIDGVSFYARVADDLRFVGEVFSRKTYNFMLGTACCLIDIGMNIGLVSLLLARKPEVMEVHAFEPFKATYDRARANLALNPDTGRKIIAYNFGLGGTDEDKTILIHSEDDSGVLSIRGAAQGRPEHIVVRDAATTLRPIIETAKSNGRDVIAKIDCEGSEFSIFATLDACGLLGEISAFMVEWHLGVEGQTQHDLLSPLIRRGFIIFDLTGESGNGFFYAVKSTGASRGSSAASDQRNGPII